MPVFFNLVAEVFGIFCSFTAQTVEEPFFCFLAEESEKMVNEAARLHFTLFAPCRGAAIAKALHSKANGFSSHLHFSVPLCLDR